VAADELAETAKVEASRTVEVILFIYIPSVMDNFLIVFYRMDRYVVLQRLVRNHNHFTVQLQAQNFKSKLIVDRTKGKLG
jgi:hypothetical protein